MNIGSVAITGEARNFSFHGDGSFHPKPGFGVFLSVGGAGGDSFKWPSWLPIHINAIGITWPDISADPTNFTLILSASVKGIQGIAGLEFSGSIEGIQIDIGKLIHGENPIVGISAFGVRSRATCSAARSTPSSSAASSSSTPPAVIDDLDTVTPVDQRVFYAGVEGGFSFAGIGGFTIRIALSELGPLRVASARTCRPAILLEPATGLTINDFAAASSSSRRCRRSTTRCSCAAATSSAPERHGGQWLTTLKPQVVDAGTGDPGRTRG